MNNPILYKDPSGEYIESPLDIAFIVYDAGSIASDVHRINQNRCHSDELMRQLWIDAGALALDVAFLALPGATGGGMGLRFALAGANATFDTTRLAQLGYYGLKGVQGVYKGVQVGGQISFFQGSGSSYRQPPLPGMEDYVRENRAEEHHFLSNKHDSFWTSTFKEITDKYGLDLNGEWNKAMVPGHSGRHTDAYHQWVYNELLRIDKLAKGNARTFLDLFNERIIAPVLQNPNLLYQK